MRNDVEVPTTVEVAVTTHGEMPGAADYARAKIADAVALAHRPVLAVRVRLSRHHDPAVQQPVVAQVNVDVNGIPLRVQETGATAREAVDRLEAGLHHRIERLNHRWEPRWGDDAGHGEWRHGSEPARRTPYFPRPEGQRRVIRRKSYTPATASVDEAAREMDQFDYDFHLFVEETTGQDSLLYRGGPTGYRLAQLQPTPVAVLAPTEVPLTVSPHPAPRLTVERAVERLGLTELPFIFFVDSIRNRGCVLYHRYDGHYGVITPPVGG